MKTLFLSFTKESKPRTIKRDGGKMKTVSLSMCAMAALLTALWVSPTRAADVTVTVTLTAVSVSVTGGPIAFGSKAAGSTTVSTELTVTNDGDAAETYSLSCSNSANWTAVQVAPGAETYCLSAMFNSDNAGTFVRADHALSTTPVACGVVTTGKFAGDESGAAVPATGVRHLWLAFEAPTSTAHYTEQTITVTITAAN
jgi:hypothetical protein